MTDELKELEETLASAKPAPLSAEQLARFTSAMENWEEHEAKPSESNVVPFPGSATAEKAGSQSGKTFGGRAVAIAACVALMGAATAVWVTSPEQETATAETQPVTTGKMIPPELKRNFFNVSDDRTFFNEADQPMRQMSIDYSEEVKLQDDQGRTIIMTEPKRQTVVVPIETN